MKITFDSAKSEKNSRDRQLSFDQVAYFDWETAHFFEDNRFIYTEQRFIGMGYLNERLHVLCFTPIEEGIRVISFRKANSREVKKYEKNYKKEIQIYQEKAANEQIW